MGKAVPETGGMKLLWENLSPGATFSPQTVTLDGDTGFKACLIVAGIYGVNDVSTSVLILFGHGAQLQSTINYTQPAWRNAKYSEHGKMTFESGYANGVPSANNNSLIPWAIYGIEF